jgi:hypothetical protein
LVDMTEKNLVMLRNFCGFCPFLWRKPLGLAVLLAQSAVLLSGCESVNDALVRRWLMEPGLSRRVNSQIREGLERRNAAPSGRAPRTPAPEFLDEG